MRVSLRSLATRFASSVVVTESCNQDALTFTRDPWPCSPSSRMRYAARSAPLLSLLASSQTAADVELPTQCASIAGHSVPVEMKTCTQAVTPMLLHSTRETCCRQLCTVVSPASSAPGRTARLLRLQMRQMRGCGRQTRAARQTPAQPPAQRARCRPTRPPGRRGTGPPLKQLAGTPPAARLQRAAVAPCAAPALGAGVSDDRNERCQASRSTHLGVGRVCAHSQVLPRQLQR